MTTGKSRVKSAIKGEGGEVAAYPMIGAVSVKFVGKTIKEYLTDPNVVVSSQLAVYEKIHPDIVTVAIDTLTEAEAMGTELKFPEDDVCYPVFYPLKEDKTKIDKLQIPDPQKDGRLPLVLEAWRELKKTVTDEPVGGGLAGPWVIATSLRGLQEVIYDTYEDPEYVHELMKIATEVAKKCGEALVETGVGLSFSEAAASCDVISPKIYKEFIKPYHTELFKHFQAKKAGATLHICGDTKPILRDLVETGVMALSIDSKVPLADAVEIIGKDVAIIGNVPTALFVQKDREAMENAVKKCLDEARYKSRYILSTGCEVPIDANLESINWFMESARKFGK